MRNLLAILLMTYGAYIHASEDNFKVMTEPSRPEKIQILLEKNVSEALIEVRGSYSVFNPEDGEKIGSGILNKRFLIYPTKNGIRWGEEYPGIHQIYIYPNNSKSSVLVNGLQYSGGVAIFQVGNKISIINDLSVEEFIKSTLSLEFYYPVEKEVLSSLAILARTNAYFYIHKNKNSFWHIDAKKINYQGTVTIIPNSDVEFAVDTTRDLILTTHFEGKNLPFAASWTEHSAGKLAPFHTVFRKEGLSPKITIHAPHAALDRKDTEWIARMTKSHLSHVLEIENVQKIEPFIDPDSNKTYALRVHHQNGYKDLDYFTFQSKIGNQIKSNDFLIKNQSHQIEFRGYGRGHSVGLCIYSATSMAENGENAVKILSHFYPNTQLINLSAMPKKMAKIPIYKHPKLADAK